MRMAFQLMTTLLSVAHGSEVLPGCNTDEDCNLNGLCVPGGGGILPWTYHLTMHLTVTPLCPK